VELKSLEVLSALAKDKKVGPTELARYCDHSSHSYISRLMRGLPGTKTVSEKTADRIAERLGVPRSVRFADREVKSADSTAA
jgi:hypothetical protein